METDEKLLELKKDFTLWRSKRRRGTPVPKKLREKSCGLLDEYNVYRIAKVCTISKNQLDTWNKNLNKTPEKKKALQFIEMNPPSLPSKETVPKKISIELTRTNGEKMMISGDIPGESLNLLLSSFLSIDKERVFL